MENEWIDKEIVDNCIYCKEEKSRSHKTCDGRLMNRLIGRSNTQNDTLVYTVKRASAFSVKILIYIYAYLYDSKQWWCLCENKCLMHCDFLTHHMNLTFFRMWKWLVRVWWSLLHSTWKEIHLGWSTGKKV